MRTDPAETSGLRKLGFRVALLLVFLRFGFLHEVLSYELGLPRTYVLFITNIAAIACALLSGGLGRTVWSPPARWWLAFSFWFLVTVPFSTWKYDSASMLQVFVVNCLSLLVVVAGLTLTLKECYAMMSAVALGGFVNVLAGNLLRSDDPSARFSLDFGSIGNSNDFAAHLFAVLPFILFVAWTRPSKIIKLLAAGTLLVGCYFITTTGSRGALIAFAVLFVFLLIRASARVRLVTVVAVPVLLGVLVLALPQNLLLRYSTLWNDTAAAVDKGATESRENREYLLRTSLRFTLENPIFGVGPGQFANAEGHEARGQGKHGLWIVPHNSYTEVSSELGIPGLLLFLAAIVSTFRTLNSIYRRCRYVPRLQTASVAAFCMMLSMLGFGVAIFFLTLGYSFYLVFFAGIAIALSRAVDKELAIDTQSTKMAQFPGAPQLRRA